MQTLHSNRQTVTSDMFNKDTKLIIAANRARNKFSATTTTPTTAQLINDNSSSNNNNNHNNNATHQRVRPKIPYLPFLPEDNKMIFNLNLPAISELRETQAGAAAKQKRLQPEQHQQSFMSERNEFSGDDSAKLKWNAEIHNKLKTFQILRRSSQSTNKRKSSSSIDLSFLSDMNAKHSLSEQRELRDKRWKQIESEYEAQFCEFLVRVRRDEELEKEQSQNSVWLSEQHQQRTVSPSSSAVAVATTAPTAAAATIVDPFAVSKHNLKFGSLLSEDGNYAILKAYEDMIYHELCTLLPSSGGSTGCNVLLRGNQLLPRMNTEAFIGLPRKFDFNQRAVAASGVGKLPPIKATATTKHSSQNVSRRLSTAASSASSSAASISLSKKAEHKVAAAAAAAAAATEVTAEAVKAATAPTIDTLRRHKFIVSKQLEKAMQLSDLISKAKAEMSGEAKRKSSIRTEDIITAFEEWKLASNLIYNIELK